MTFIDVDSGVFLPSLAELRTLPLREREAALQGWVVWLDANRHRVSRTVERLLDRALRQLRDESVHMRSSAELDEGVDGWLENAGSVGRGRGPDQDREGV